MYGDIEAGHASREGDALRPSSPYSASKAGGDLQVLAAVRTYGVDAAITRGSNNYGPNQYPEKLIPLFTTNLLDGEPVPVYGDGRQSRDFIYVEDHCAGIETVLERGASGEIYNVGGGNEIENLTTTMRLLELTGRDESHIRYVTDRPGHDRRYALDTSKLQGLGWHPEVTFDEGLQRTVEWYRDNRAVVGADQARRRLRGVPAQAVRRRRPVTEGAAAPGANGTYLDAFAVGEFRALFAAYTVSMLGDIVAAVALTVLVFQRTGSPFLAGVTFTLAFVPYLFSGALLSSLVDRVPPRRLMIGCDLLSAAIVALMASSAVPVPALLALLFLLGLISPVAAGMRNRLLVVVLPAAAFIAGRSLFRIVAQSAQVVGNAAGGLLIALTSPRGALLLDCASFLGSALVVRLATRARAPLGGGAGDGARGNVLRDSLGGMSAVLADRRIRRVLLLGWLVPTCSVAPESLAAPYVAHLGLSGATVGWWLAAIPAGTIAGELVAIWFVPPAWRLRLIGVLAAATVRAAARVRRAARAGLRAAAARCLRPLQRLGARSGRADPRGHARSICWAACSASTRPA